MDRISHQKAAKSKKPSIVCCVLFPVLGQNMGQSIVTFNCGRAGFPMLKGTITTRAFHTSIIPPYGQKLSIGRDYISYYLSYSSKYPVPFQVMQAYQEKIDEKMENAAKNRRFCLEKREKQVFKGQSSFAPWKICAIIHGKHDPGGAYHAGKQQSTAPNRHLR